jgi:predicted ATP-grasp superfamily ATP-dependent carboligase
MRVLVTDADYKQTLCATRSLGRRGIHVAAGSSRRRAQSFYSKYCRERLLYPSPQRQDEFASFLLSYVQTNEIDVVLPVGYFATTALSRHKDSFSGYASLPVADYDSMRVASNKDLTLQLARDLGIRTPMMYDSPADVEEHPVVEKAVGGSGSVLYINSRAGLSRVPASGWILQEYVPGDAYGFFALFNQGRVRATFMHRRVREYPVTGGPSTTAESVRDPELEALGLRLLETLNWHGAAMVEFKKDSRDGEFTLLEVNPKFWGSLGLAIACGVDFPYLAARMAADGDVDAVSDYRLGVRFRWPLPDDVLHLLAKPRAVGSFLRDSIDRNVRSDISLRDPKPNLFQVLLTLRSIATRLREGSLRYPHGVPEGVP